jgi:hypothetical protein
MAEVVELARWMRELLDRSRVPIRELAMHTHYGRDTVSRNLTGDRCPTWEFVHAVVSVCAGADEHGKGQLLAEARSRWEAAGLARAHPVTPAAPGGPAGDVHDGSGGAQASLERAQQLTGQAQQLTAYYQVQCQRLLAVQGRLQEALRAAARERDKLLRAVVAGQQEAAELGRVQHLLDETRGELHRTQDLLAVALAARDRAQRTAAEANRKLSSLAEMVLCTTPAGKAVPEMAVGIVGEVVGVPSVPVPPGAGMPDALEFLGRLRADIEGLIEGGQPALAALVYAVSVVPAVLASGGQADGTGPQEPERGGVMHKEGQWLILRPIREARRSAQRRRSAGRLSGWRLMAIVAVEIISLSVIPTASGPPAALAGCLPSNVCNPAKLPTDLMVWPTPDLNLVVRQSPGNIVIPNRRLAVLPYGTGVYGKCYQIGHWRGGPWGRSNLWLFVDWTTVTAWAHGGFISGAFADIRRITPWTPTRWCPLGLHGW